MNGQPRMTSRTTLTNGAGKAERAHRISPRKFTPITPADGIEHPVAHGILISGSTTGVVRIKLADDDEPHTMELAAGIPIPMDIISLEATGTEAGLTVFFIY